MNKESQFIAQILGTKKLSTGNKRKLLALVESEIKKGVEIDQELLLQLQEQSLTQRTNNTLVREIVEEAKDWYDPGKSLKYINPRNITNYLSMLNADPILRSTTHAIDSNLLIDILDKMKRKDYDYTTHLSYIQKSFQNLNKTFGSDVLKGLKGKLKEYYFSGGQGWSEDKIKIGWSSDVVKNWCAKHPGQCPNPDEGLRYGPCEIPDPFVELKNGDLLSTFPQIINHFKMQIECRDDSFLEKALAKENKADFKTHKIDLSGIQPKLLFYTDVEKILQAYRIIINLCIDEHKKQNKSPEDFHIKVGLEKQNTQNSRTVVLSIFHQSSIFGKDIDSLFDRYGNTFHGLIDKQLNGLCNLELSADFPNNISANISIWPSPENYTRLDQAVNGVKYNLVFYK